MLQITSEYLSRSMALIAIILNLLLLPLIAFKSSPLMGSYKYLLFIYTLHSIVYAGFGFLLNPLYYISSGWFLLIIPRPLIHFSIFTGTCVFLIYICCWIQIVVIIMLCFLHRYWSLLKSHHQSWFHNKQKICIIVVVDLIFMAISAVDTVWGCWPGEEKNRIMENDVLLYTGINISAVPYIGGPEWIDGVLQISTASPSILCVIFSAIILFFIFFMITKILAIFRKMLPQMTRTNIRYQKRIFYLLICQTFIPLFFTISPGVIFHFCALFRIDFMTSTILLLSSFMSFAQCIDPIVTFLLVYEYRRAVRGIIRSWIKIDRNDAKKTRTDK